MKPYEDDNLTEEEQNKVGFELGKSPFKKWTQLNNQEIKSLIYLNMKSPLATNILYFLWDNCDMYNSIIISQKTLGKILGKSQQGISNAMKILREYDFIRTSRTAGGMIIYLNGNVTWCSYGTNQKFAEFTSKIIFSQDEIKQLGTDFSSFENRKGSRVIKSKNNS